MSVTDFLPWTLALRTPTDPMLVCELAAHLSETVDAADQCQGDASLPSDMERLAGEHLHAATQVLGDIGSELDALFPGEWKAIGCMEFEDSDLPEMQKAMTPGKQATLLRLLQEAYTAAARTWSALSHSPNPAIHETVSDHLHTCLIQIGHLVVCSTR